MVTFLLLIDYSYRFFFVSSVQCFISLLLYLLNSLVDGELACNHAIMLDTALLNTE